MLKMKLKDGTAFGYLEAVETEEYWGGASRRTLTVTALPDAASIDALAAVLTEENLSTVTLENDDDAKRPITNLYEGYVLVLGCGLQSVQTAAETPEAPALYEQRLVVKLGRRTYIEAALAALGLAGGVSV